MPPCYALCCTVCCAIFCASCAQWSRNPVFCQCMTLWQTHLIYTACHICYRNHSWDLCRTRPNTTFQPGIGVGAWVGGGGVSKGPPMTWNEKLTKARVTDLERFDIKGREHAPHCIALKTCGSCWYLYMVLAKYTKEMYHRLTTHAPLPQPSPTIPNRCFLFVGAQTLMKALVLNHRFMI